MRRRYTILGLTGVLAVALTVPALGGPSNPIASSAASAKKVANKALRKANEAKSAADAAQASANQALSAANSANGAVGKAQTDATKALADAASAKTAADNAQTTANQAIADGNTVTDTEIGLQFVNASDTSTSTAGLDIATAVTDCGAKQALGAMGFVSDPEVALQGVFIFYDPLAIGAEMDNTGATFTVTAQGTCMNNG